MKSLAQVLLSVLLIYFLLQVVMNFGFSVLMLIIHNIKYDFPLPIGEYLPLLIVYGIAIAGLIILLTASKKIAGFIVPQQADDQNRTTPADWILPAYRIMAVLVGLWLFYRVFDNIVNTVSMLAFSQMTGLTMQNILPGGLLLAAGVYFIFGAPHFVRWQSRKTTRLCAPEPGQNDPPNPSL